MCVLGSLYSVEELQTQTFCKCNHRKSLPLTPQFSADLTPPDELPLHHTNLQTHSQKALIFSLLHLCPPRSELQLGQRGYAFLLSFLPSRSHLLFKNILPPLCRNFQHPPPSLAFPCLLHAGWAINVRDMLVLKACKTEHYVSAEGVLSLSSIEMGHLVRNPIKNIPYKLKLFFPLLGLITKLLYVQGAP